MPSNVMSGRDSDILNPSIMLHPSCSAKSLNRSPKISALEGMARSEMWLDSEGIRTKEGAHRWVVQYGSRIPVVPVDVRRTILQDFRNRASCTSLKTCTNWSAKPWISCWVCPHMRCWTLKLICVCMCVCVCVRASRRLRDGR